MNRAALVGPIAFALLVPALFAPTVVGCHPKEPREPVIADPVADEHSAEGSGASAGSGAGAQAGSSSGARAHDDSLAPPPSGANAGSGKKGEAASVASLAPMMEGLRWGMSHAEVTKAFTDNGGVIWKDYDEKLAKARVGPEMTAIENEREQAKLAFGRTFIEFKDTPTGYDATGIKGEFTYKNRESLMWIQRKGKKRYFFFINDRLWKIYDEVPLAEGGPLGKTFVDAVNKLSSQLGAAGRIHAAEPAKGVHATTVDWKDGQSHLRAVDRSSEQVVGVAVEDNATLGNLASLRPNKSEDPTAIDPSISAVTKGGLSDPNAPKAAPSSSAAPKKAPPKKK